MFHRSSAPAPEYVLTRHKWAAAAWFTSLFLFVLLPPPVPRRLTQLTHLPEWSPLIPFLLATVIYVTWAFRLKRSLRLLAEPAEFTLCTRCAYDISPLERATPPDDSNTRHIRCPECGTLINPRDARTLWREYLTR